MAKYLISFPSAAMAVSEGELAVVARDAHAVIDEAKAAGVYIFAGGIDEGVPPMLVSADGTVAKGGYPWAPPLDGGFTVLELASQEEAIAWAARIAKACRCEQELRVFGDDPRRSQAGTLELGQTEERHMRPLRYSINVTLDGCCDHRAIPAGQELHSYFADRLAEADALLFGRTTYEMMEEAWRLPATGVWPDWMADWMQPFARTIDGARKYVVSSTLDQVDWNAELIHGDLGEQVRKLKRQPGRGLYVGGVKLPLALAELGLIDEYEFVVHPRLAGHGPALFAGLSKYVDLKLVGRKEFDSGAVALRYEPVGSGKAAVTGSSST